MNIYQMNEYDWVCANSEEEAMEVYKKHLALCLGEDTDDYKETLEDTKPEKLTDEQLDKYTFREEYEKERTFRQELTKRTGPGFFASTEY